MGCDEVSVKDIEKEKEEVIKRIKEISFPVTLKFSSEGDYQPYYKTLEKTTDYKITYSNKFDFYEKTFKSEYERSIEMSIGTGNNAELSLELFGFGINPSVGINSSKSTKDAKELKLCKGVCSSIIQKATIELERSSIKICDYVLDEIKYIIYSSELPIEDKVNELIKFFRKVGYFIPMQIHFGGKFNSIYNSITMSESHSYSNKIKNEYNLKLDTEGFLKIPGVKLGIGVGKNFEKETTHENKIKTSDKEISIKAIGGNSTSIDELSKYKNWLKSLKPTNMQIIGYDEISTIDEFFPYELRNNFTIFKKLIIQYFEQQRKEYEKYLKELEKQSDQLIKEYEINKDIFDKKNQIMENIRSDYGDKSQFKFNGTICKIGMIEESKFVGFMDTYIPNNSDSFDITLGEGKLFVGCVLDASRNNSEIETIIIKNTFLTTKVSIKFNLYSYQEVKYIYFDSPLRIYYITP